jgi:hypothetical protein
MMKFNIIILILFYCSLSFSQVKNEKEERIEASEFPKNSLLYLNAIATRAKNIKYYKETDGEKSSYEAKFKLNKLHYSIEFNTLGKLEDIEIVIKEKHIPEPILNKIMDYYKNKYAKVRFIKIQKQFVNTSDKSDHEFLNYVLDNPIGKNTHFEIIAEIKTKEDKTRLLKEFTFENTGKFEKSRPISSSSYEHALY